MRQRSWGRLGVLQHPCGHTHGIVSNYSFWAQLCGVWHMVSVCGHTSGYKVSHLSGPVYVTSPRQVGYKFKPPASIGLPDNAHDRRLNAKLAPNAFGQSAKLYVYGKWQPLLQLCISLGVMVKCTLCPHLSAKPACFGCPPSPFPSYCRGPIRICWRISEGISSSMPRRAQRCVPCTTPVCRLTSAGALCDWPRNPINAHTQS